MQNFFETLFADALPRLRYRQCKRRPAPVYLCAGHRLYTGGPAADWTFELVPPPKDASPQIRVKSTEPHVSDTYRHSGGR